MAATGPAPALDSPIRRHHKRGSLSRFSSDTTTSLPPYRPSLVVSEPSEQPPDYPDSAEEADEETETDDQVTQLLSPPISPRQRRRKLLRSSSQPPIRLGCFYDNPSTQSDIFLDKILERSVAALELSNTLLQSSMSTHSSLNNVLSPETPSADDSLDSKARLLSDRIRGNNHARWMDDLDVLARDVESLFGDKHGPSTNGVDIPGRLKVPSKSPDEMVSRSLPPTSTIRKPHRSATDLCRRGSDCGRLRLTTDQRILSASAPRAMTQYVNVDAEFKGTHESSSNVSQSILLPSTTGLRSSSTISSLSSPISSSFSPPPPCPSSAYASLASQVSRSPRSSRSPSASGSSIRTYRQRSSSRSSSNRASSPHLLPRIIPPPIQELPSQSDSSSCDSPHPLRTLESLRKILDEQPMQPNSPTDSKGKQVENKLAPRSAPAFQPRSPPVEPVLSTSTTTTSISRLYTKGSHSTSTRPRSPPRHSSLKRRPPPLETDPSSSITSISSLRSPLPARSSATSSGRSTPRSVAFGPLPEPHHPEGAPSRFKEQREAKAKAKKRSRSRSSSRAGGKDGKGKGGHEKEKEKEESSWWTTWLTGGSVLTTSASRVEERVEDRIARAWGRPGVFEEWPV